VILQRLRGKIYISRNSWTVFFSFC